MPTIKFHYFDIEGRGEVIRLIFAAGGVDFFDERIDPKDWPTLKTSKFLFTIRQWFNFLLVYYLW